MDPATKRLWVWMTVFFIAMAFLESAVVVYLRALYYPDGFRFPLVPMDPGLVATEVGREFATLVMLLAPAALVTRSALGRFAWFCYGFGVWDIFYYVWLKVLLDWPASLTEPDLLFLIPVPWVGPVWAPITVSVGLIVLAVLLLRGQAIMPEGLVDEWTWTLLVSGAVLIILSFVSGQWTGALDPTTGPSAPAWPSGTGRSDAWDHPWPWFAAGCMLAFAGLWRVGRRGLGQP